jgi:hypothetical protein
MLFLCSEHLTLGNPSTGVKGFTTRLDVLSSTNLTPMPSLTTTAMATKILACPLTLEFNTQGLWCSKAQ